MGWDGADEGDIFCALSLIVISGNEGEMGWEEVEEGDVFCALSLGLRRGKEGELSWDALGFSGDTDAPPECSKPANGS
jgi:hypothetical protein